MSASSFEELASHAGHEIEVVLYGKENDADNAAAECVTCSEVLLDFDKYPEELAPQVVLCGTDGDSLPDVYGPFEDETGAAEFLIEHRSQCPKTDQAWLDNPDEADENHYIVGIIL